ncbi:hypothetical protein SETIT_4G057400v2 [Setaria italica]|uniref:Uncharacterized protein n=1 Tax=Setaria italica TaxID=4555 RepID=A0A368QR66_SETIT|nr:hypothetical protein SETIT_4G057400v2 [Setaria italica]
MRKRGEFLEGVEFDKGRSARRRRRGRTKDEEGGEEEVGTTRKAAEAAPAKSMGSPRFREACADNLAGVAAAIVAGFRTATGRRKNTRLGRGSFEQILAHLGGLSQNVDPI